MAESRDEIRLQNQEFEALTALARQWERLRLTPVVDDDYPQIRHEYESALRVFVGAYNTNRRVNPMVVTADEIRTRLIYQIALADEHQPAAKLRFEANRTGLYLSYPNTVGRPFHFPPGRDVWLRVTDNGFHLEVRDAS